MTKLAVLFIVGVLAAGGLHPPGETKSKAPAPSTSPEALYRQSQQLQAQLEAVEAAVRDLEYRRYRTRKAIANYDYVYARNEKLIRRLRKWVDSPPPSGPGSGQTAAAEGERKP